LALFLPAERAGLSFFTQFPFLNSERGFHLRGYKEISSIFADL
jgi:hypothetical protein